MYGRGVIRINHVVVHAMPQVSVMFDQLLIPHLRKVFLHAHALSHAAPRHSIRPAASSP